MTFVIDASITMAWCFKEEPRSFAANVLRRVPDSQAIAPSIWPLEVANALLVGERRKRLTRADTAHLLLLLRALPIRVDEETPRRALESILSLAREQNLSSYDAAYLELAIRQGCALATLDDDLRRAATALGVPVFEG